MCPFSTNPSETRALDSCLLDELGRPGDEEATMLNTCGLLGSTRSVVLVVVVGASAAGCDRCGRKDTATPSPTGTTGNAAPIIVMMDGGAVRTQSVITEEIAARVAGPVPSGGRIAGATTPMAVECKSPAQGVSPTLFGIAWADADKDLGATAHRWGGNTTSRYNPRLGAWNTASDWFWQNVKVDSHEVFLAKAAERGGLAAVTVPMLGWVAKDTTSASFPVSALGPQEKTDPDHRDFGNGKKPDGKTPVPPGDPARTSVKFTPDDASDFVAKVRAFETKLGKKIVFEWILDNEPGLWNSTHRDVHPEPLTYDELLEKTIAFGTAIRKADPNAVIAGPASFGWWEYFYSAKDQQAGFRLKPDRRAHGDTPRLVCSSHRRNTRRRRTRIHRTHLPPQTHDGGARRPTSVPATRHGQRIGSTHVAQGLRNRRAQIEPVHGAYATVLDVLTPARRQPSADGRAPRRPTSAPPRGRIVPRPREGPARTPRPPAGPPGGNSPALAPARRWQPPDPAEPATGLRATAPTARSPTQPSPPPRRPAVFPFIPPTPLTNAFKPTLPPRAPPPARRIAQPSRRALQVPTVVLWSRAQTFHSRGLSRRRRSRSTRHGRPGRPAGPRAARENSPRAERHGSNSSAARPWTSV